MPVVDAFRQHDKVVDIDAMKDVEVVYASIRAAVDKLLA